MCARTACVYDCTSIRYVHAYVIDVQYMHVKFTTFYTYQAKTLAETDCNWDELLYCSGNLSSTNIKACIGTRTISGYDHIQAKVLNDIQYMHMLKSQHIILCRLNRFWFCSKEQYLSKIKLLQKNFNNNKNNEDDDDDDDDASSLVSYY